MTSPLDVMVFIILSLSLEVEDVVWTAVRGCACVRLLAARL